MKLESLEMKATLFLKIPKTYYKTRSATSAKTILECEAVKISRLGNYSLFWICMEVVKGIYAL
jgi:hypothetical protein